MKVLWILCISETNRTKLDFTQTDNSAKSTNYNITWELDCFMHLWNFSFETEIKLTTTASNIHRGICEHRWPSHKVSLE